MILMVDNMKKNYFSKLETPKWLDRKLIKQYAEEKGITEKEARDELFKDD